MKNLLISTLVLIQMLGCKSNEQIPQQETRNIDALYQQFHGKYRIVSAVSNEEVDVNLDGKASTDLLTEIEELTIGSLTNPYSEIRIYKPSQLNPEASFLFTQAWPQQFVRMGNGKVWDGLEMIAYNPNYSFAYDMKVVVRKFDFSEDLKQLTVVPDNSEAPIFLQSSPKSVSVLDDGKIVVTADRKIYTSEGVKQITVTTTYERFTMTT
ncbi:hypothetical protein DSL64_00005 [Dyadobacter luteus]|jgi:hypothetical protein|uniref:Uncharacterized protein n=1 Tax=Dyadobacter luteus TaxID=2259619 RepID=A0A3D8YGT3_9BACT|nr:hypothetical protein [Dyadobacter luteus]REA63994.1 hypothetical protein DSL64_00005 [Dyadobacter luteus]